MSAAGAVIKSLLKDTIHKLPETYARKTGKGAIADLVKKGVKAEELKYAKLAIPEGKVTKESLVKAEAKRQDWFETVDAGKDYRDTTIGGKGFNNPTYREKVLTFKQADGKQPEVVSAAFEEFRNNIDAAVKTPSTNSAQLFKDAQGLGYSGKDNLEEIEDWALYAFEDITADSRYTSSHYSQPDYLMHTRVYDETFEGTPTRVLTEIQSDLHQAGRQHGYDVTPEPIPKDKLNTLWAAVHEPETLDEGLAIARDYGFNGQQDAMHLEEWIVTNGQSRISAGDLGVPQSPLEKNWLRKGLERELVDATNEGRTQLAIPIKGEVDSLMTAEQKSILRNFGDEGYTGGYTTKAHEILTANGFERDYLTDPDELMQAVDKLLRSSSTALDNLSRGEGVQKWYETTVVKTAQKVAKQTDSEFAMKTIDGVDYAIIKPKSVGSLEGLTLYSTPVAGAFVAYQAYKSGMSQQQVESKLISQYNYDAEDVDELRKRVDVITQAETAGYTMDEIKAKMEGKEIEAETSSSEPESYWAGIAKEGDEATITDHYQDQQLPGGAVIGGRFFSGDIPKADKFNDLINATKFMDEEELLSSMKILYPTMTSDLMTTIPAYFGNKDALQRYDKARAASKSRITSLAKEKYGLDLELVGEGPMTGTWLVHREDGAIQEINEGVWQSIKDSKFEIAGGIAGMAAGAKLGAKAGATAALVAGQLGPQAAMFEEILTMPITATIMGVAGAAVGGWGGSSAGAGYDYLYTAIKMHEDLEGAAMAYRSLNALEAAAIFELPAYGIGKIGQYGFKGLMGAKNIIKGGGETKAAYRAIKEVTFMDDSEIAEVVTQLRRHTDLSKNKYKAGVQAVSITQPGMQELVKAAGGINPKASAATAISITRRADQVLAQTASLTDEQVPRMLTHDLMNYTLDVKDNYGRVKAMATQSPKGLNFKWNFDNLAIKPVLESLERKITNPAAKEKYLLQMRRIMKMSESRNFGDLIELRQMTNDFLFNKRIVKADDKNTLREVLGNIDAAIEVGANTVVENPKQWLSDWAMVRKDYSEMKKVEATTFYRSMFDKNGAVRGIKPEAVVKSLGKYITALDGSFENMMTKLPVKGRAQYEGAVIDALAQRYTAGAEKGSKAVHFPMLADELKKINFTTPEARATKKAMIELGEVFKNDIYLAQTSGLVSIPKFQSYLTADPIVRAKFEVASGMFNFVKSKLPGAGNRQLALVRSTAKLLEKPLDSKNFKLLQQEVFGDANLSRQVLEVQQVAARNINKQTPVLKVYEGGKLKGTGEAQSIPMHRVATLQQAKEIADTEALTLDSKALDSVLKQYGYKAILEGSDRVRFLGAK